MVKIDKESCIGCGACVSICPKVFELKDGKAEIKTGQEDSKESCFEEAKDSCPVEAIH